jgi:hypothetical protein
MAKKVTRKVRVKVQHILPLVGIFTVLGILWLVRGFAATGSRALEAEASTRSGSQQVVADSSASGDSLVRLNAASQAAGKPRMIVMTDGEIDDTDSFVRFLYYTNDFEVVGIVATNSRWQQNGHGRGWIDSLLDAYAQIRPNLILHDPAYPTVEYLRSKVAIGIEDVNTIWGTPPFADTPGSELILNELRKSDPRPLYINAWGGSNTTAQALYKLKNMHPTEYAAAASKAKLFTIHSTPEGQDNGWKWIGDNIPETETIVNFSYNGTWDYWGDKNPYADEYKSTAWLNTNVKNGHGPLGAKYAQDYVSEGDTPAFMALVANGLRAYEHPTFGGWGGRFLKDYSNVWVDAMEGGSIHTVIARWFPAAQNDFSARMDWSVQPYGGANHHPRITITGAQNRTVTANATVTLQAQVTDPDNNSVTSQWWQYKEAGTAGAVNIANATSAANASFVVPNEPGKTIHIILEVTDNGTPALKRYERIVFTIQ